MIILSLPTQNGRYRNIESGPVILYLCPTNLFRTNSIPFINVSFDINSISGIIEPVSQPTRTFGFLSTGTIQKNSVNQERPSCIGEKKVSKV